MATTAPKPTRPTMPAQPDTLRWLIEDHNLVMKALNNVIQYGYQIGADVEARTTEYTADIRAQQDLIKEWYATDEGRAYSVAVDRYNAAATAWNAYVKGERQARKNTRQVAAIRSAACPRCTMTHAGEC
jgi:NADPH-dependent ferric siderophore reductase